MADQCIPYSISVMITRLNYLEVFILTFLSNVNVLTLKQICVETAENAKRQQKINVTANRSRNTNILIIFGEPFLA